MQARPCSDNALLGLAAIEVREKDLIRAHHFNPFSLKWDGFLLPARPLIRLAVTKATAPPNKNAPHSSRKFLHLDLTLL